MQDIDKSKISITAVANRLGLNVKNGKFRCIFHENHANGDRTPSVSINESKGFFKCFVCPEFKGDVYSLIQLVQNCSFSEAKKYLNEDAPSIIRDSTGIAKTPAAQIEDTQHPPFFKEKIIFDFLKQLSPVQTNSPIAWYLAKRHIYKHAWDKALLRVLDDYAKTRRKMLELHSLQDLQFAGLFNKEGNLRFGRHPLIIPYIDEKQRPFYFQARAIDKNIKPKELNLQGAVPFPFHKEVLDGKQGLVYLCEGAIDTLTLMVHDFPAVGIPGANSFKPEWTELFQNKTVILCLDNDTAGMKASERILNLFEKAGIEARIFDKLPEGKDINSWLCS